MLSHGLFSLNRGPPSSGGAKILTMRGANLRHIRSNTSSNDIVHKFKCVKLHVRTITNITKYFRKLQLDTAFLHVLKAIDDSIITNL